MEKQKTEQRFNLGYNDCIARAGIFQTKKIKRVIANADKKRCSENIFQRLEIFYLMPLLFGRHYSRKKYNGEKRTPCKRKKRRQRAIRHYGNHGK